MHRYTHLVSVSVVAAGWSWSSSLVFPRSEICELPWPCELHHPWTPTFRSHNLQGARRGTI